MPAERIDEQYRQHIWSQSKTTGETAQSSTAKLFHYPKSLSIESRLARARLGPLRGHYGGYKLRGLMTQPILPTRRTRAREAAAVKPQDILLGDGAQKEFEGYLPEAVLHHRTAEVPWGRTTTPSI